MTPPGIGLPHTSLSASGRAAAGPNGFGVGPGTGHPAGVRSSLSGDLLNTKSAT